MNSIYDRLPSLWANESDYSNKELNAIFNNAIYENDGIVCYYKSLAYFRGRILHKDIMQAKINVEKALQQNVPNSYNLLFDILWSLETDAAYKESVNVIKPFADKGDVKAKWRLAKALWLGKGITRNFSEAIKIMTSLDDRLWLLDFEEYLSFCGMIWKFKRKLTEPEYDLNVCDQSKKTLIIVGRNNKEFVNIVEHFPICWYNLIAWIRNENDTTYYYDTKDNTKADRYLLCSEKDQDLLPNVPSSRIIRHTYFTKMGIKWDKFYTDESPETDKYVMIPGQTNGVLWNYGRLNAVNSQYKVDLFVDMQNYPNANLSVDHMGLYNPWDLYFKDSYDFSKIYNGPFNVCNSNDIKLPPCRSGLNDNASEIMITLLQKHLSEIDMDKTLGVNLRGTDYFHAYAHQSPFDQYEASCIVDNYCKRYNCDKIYLSTEDYEDYCYFKDKYKDKLISLERVRIKRGQRANKSNSSGYDGLVQGLFYLLDILIQSNLKYILSTKGNGFSFLLSNRDEKSVIRGDLLSKNHYGLWGEDPLTVIKTGRNIYNSEPTNNTTSTNKTKYDNGTITFNGSIEKDKPIVIVDWKPIVMNCKDPYFFSVSTDFKSGNVQFELQSEDGAVTSIQSNHFHMPDKKIISIRTILMPSNNSSNISFYLKIQIEKGFSPTPFEPYHFSETVIAVRSRFGILYQAKYLDYIDIDRGIMSVGSNELSMDLEQIDLLKRAINYNLENVYFKIGNISYNSPIFGKRNSVDEKLCIDYSPNSYNDKISGMAKGPLLSLLIAYAKYPITAIGALNVCIHSNIDINVLKSIADYYLDSDSLDVTIIYMLQKMVEKIIDGAPNNIQLYHKLAKKTNDSIIIGDYLTLLADLTSQKIPEALLLSSNLYRDGIFVNKNPDKSTLLLKQAADKGLESAQLDYFEYLRSKGKNQEAIDYIKPIAESGSRDSQAKLGLMYYHGRGVDRDLDLATLWLGKAADQGLNWAKKSYCHALFEINSEESDKKLLNYITPMVNTGDPEYLAQMGRLYLLGRGVPTNLNEAKNMLNIAVNSGIHWAREYLDMIVEKENMMQ